MLTLEYGKRPENPKTTLTKLTSHTSQIYALVPNKTNRVSATFSKNCCLTLKRQFHTFSIQISSTFLPRLLDDDLTPDFTKKIDGTRQEGPWFCSFHFMSYLAIKGTESLPLCLGSVLLLPWRPGSCSAPSVIFCIMSVFLSILSLCTLPLLLMCHYITLVSCHHSALSSSW